jgi:hypothetical protein
MKSFLLFYLILLFVCCSEPVSQPAHPPVIQSFSLSRHQLYTKEYIEVQAVVTDADKGDKLNFTWSSTGGVFANPNNLLTQWHSPESPGNFTIQFKASDGYFVVDTSSTVTVLSPD